MAYVLPRAVIVLIAWGTTCLIANTFTAIDPRVFYVAGGVWSLVGLLSFSYMNNLSEQAEASPVRVIAPLQTAAE
jgi:hypothetical protein